MFNRRRLFGICVGITAVGISILLARWFTRDQQLKSVRRLRNHLTSADSPSVSSIQRERLVGDLMRKVDVLDPGQVRQLWRETSAEYIQRMRENAVTHHNLCENERAAFLDEDILRLEQWRDVWRAVRTDSVFWPRRNRRSWRGRRVEGRNERTLGGDQTSTSRRRRDPEAGGRRERRRQRPSGEGGGRWGPNDQPNRAELDAYLQALNARCEERGLAPIRLGRRWSHRR